ncbi:MAG: adenosylcobinamide amidohydrolase [Candidatus Bathyarchaeota archaeon]|nr:adenosylcobinamide amidohydrolase [Candidatus Bathyarchaeota archaeon]
MRQFELVGKGVKLVLSDNVLAVLSDAPLTTVSSAFHNGGGVKTTKVIINAEVTKAYSDRVLHANPEAFLEASARKFGVTESYIGMATAAAVDNFALVSKKTSHIGVSVMATAADNAGNTCNHSESAGEPIEIMEHTGTINIIAIIDGNPTESALVGTIITATEAKMAALRELDIRSRYSGDEATGTVTDAITVAATNRGAPIVYGGPASELGQLVGFCTKKAVKEAVMKANECMPSRSILSRLKERHLPVEHLASELAKVKSLGVEESAIAALLVKVLQSDALAASVVWAAVKIAEDIEKGVVPPEFGKPETLSKRFGAFFTKQAGVSDEEHVAVDLPLFLKDVLIGIVHNALSTGKTESLK